VSRRHKAIFTSVVAPLANSQQPHKLDFAPFRSLNGQGKKTVSDVTEIAKVARSCLEVLHDNKTCSSSSSDKRQGLGIRTEAVQTTRYASHAKAATTTNHRFALAGAWCQETG